METSKGNVTPTRVKRYPFRNERESFVEVEPDDVNFNRVQVLTNSTDLLDQEKPSIRKTTQDLTDDELFRIMSNKEVYNLEDLAKLRGRKIPFLIEGIIPKWAITILAGESAVGKSTFTLQICSSILLGNSELLGRRVNMTNRSIIYVSTEDGPYQITYRLEKQCEKVFDGQKVRVDNFRLVNTIAALKTEMKKSMAGLIIVDTLGDFFKDDLNSGTDIRSFFDELKKLIIEHGCTVLMLHHFGKAYKDKAPNKNQLIGSQSIEGAARQVLSLTLTKGGYRRLDFLKCNYLSEKEKSPIFLKMDDDKMLFEKVDGKMTPEEVGITYDFKGVVPSGKIRKNAITKENIVMAKKLESEGYTQEQIAEKIGKSKPTICRWLKRAS